MQVTVRAFGGAVAAFGVVRLIWDFGATRSLGSGHVSPRLFIYILPVALVGWLLMRWLTPGGMRPAALALWTTGRNTLLTLVLLLPTCSVFASGALGKPRAYLTTLKADLFTLASAEQEFHKDSGSYTANLERLNWKPSLGAHPPTITAGRRAWSAINSHTQLGETRCGIAVGTVNPITETLEDDIVCAPLALPLDKGSVGFDIFLIIVGVGIGMMADPSKSAPEQEPSV